MSNRGIDLCRGCDGTELFLALSLGSSPLANNLIDGVTNVCAFPLELRVCRKCGLGQLGEFQSPEELFLDYPYLSSTSQSWLESNREFALGLLEYANLEQGDLIVEVASNDGYLLKVLQEYGMAVIGIEPAKNVAEIAVGLGVPTINEFFGLSVSKTLKSNQDYPKVIIAKNVIAHVPDLQDFVSGLSELASDETLIVIEAPTISQILSGLQFDTVYHEHFSYVSELSLGKVLERFDLEICGAESLETHGGSVRFFIRRVGGSFSPLLSQVETLREISALEARLNIREEKAWEETQKNVSLCIANFRLWLENADPTTETVAYGAAAKGVTLLAAANVKPRSINYVIDNSPAKIGMFYPLTGIRIMSEADFVSQMGAGRYRYIVFPWNLIEEIKGRIQVFDNQAEIFTALPFPG